MPERFRLRPDAMARVASRVNRRFAVTAALAFALLVAIFVASSRGGDGSGRTLAFGLLLLLGLVVATYVRRQRRFRARWASFEILLEPDAIARSLDGRGADRLSRAEVASVEERAAGLVIRGPGGRALFVPRELDGYDRVRAVVTGWRCSPGTPAPPAGSA